MQSLFETKPSAGCNAQGKGLFLTRHLLRTCFSVRRHTQQEARAPREAIVSCSICFVLPSFFFGLILMKCVQKPMSSYTAVSAWYVLGTYPPSCSSFASFRHRQRFVAFTSAFKQHKTGHHWFGRQDAFAPRNSKFHTTFRRGNFQL